MKIEEVIKQLESILDHTRSMAASPDADDIWRKDIDALKFALTALRSMQEAGEPLSLEQLKQMDGKPVWIVEFPDWGHWELSEDAEDYLCDRDTELYGLTYPDPDGKVGLHKLGWLAYAYPPAHIDRSEWISVKERLPNKGKNVLVYATAKYIGGEKTAIDRLEEGEKHPIWMYTHGWFEVTHWMPLPEPPEED